MSLAMYAAPFNENLHNNNSNDENEIEKKRVTRNKTQKRYPKEGLNSEKVNSVLDEIHNTVADDDEESGLGDFHPPPMPESSGVGKTIATENMQNMISAQNIFRVSGKAPEPINNDYGKDLDLNNFKMNYGDNKSIEDYYNTVLPGHKNPANKQYYRGANTITSAMDNNNNPDVLLQKLNYMIHLLEEKQDEKTNNVTEEVVLYSFLGIFIIFVVDSFARVGKYVR